MTIRERLKEGNRRFIEHHVVISSLHESSIRTKNMKRCGTSAFSTITHSAIFLLRLERNFGTTIYEFTVRNV